MRMHLSASTRNLTQTVLNCHILVEAQRWGRPQVSYDRQEYVLGIPSPQVAAPGLCLDALQNSHLRYRKTIYNLLFAPRFFLLMGRKCLKHCSVVGWSFTQIGLLRSLLSLPVLSLGLEILAFSSPARLQIIGHPVNLDCKTLSAKPYYTCFKTGCLSLKLISLIGPT